MKNKYVLGFALSALVFLAASCSKQPLVQNQLPPQNQATSTPPNTTDNWNTYKSPDKYGFSVKYPSEFGFDTDFRQVQALSYIPVCDQNLVACIFLNRNDYKGTNFDGAGVSVNIDPSLNTEAKCYDFKVSTSEAQTQVADVTINGVGFKSATGGGGAAGHYDKLQVYRNFHNGMCYELAQDMVSTQIANYPAGTVTQFDENAVWQKLQGVVNTFEFTSAPTSGAVPANNQVTITGTTICLPHKNVKPGQMQTQECAIGLKDDVTGKNYSLKNANPPFYDNRVKIKVVGTLEDDSASNYDTSGAINVTSITKVSK